MTQPPADPKFSERSPSSIEMSGVQRLESDSTSLLEAPDEAKAVDSNLLKRRPNQTVYRRIGFGLIFTCLFTLALLFGAVAVISFLWFAGDTNLIWRRIITEGWISQAITLSTLVVRLSISTSGAAAVAMLACISVESRDGVLLQHLPAVSIHQYTNPGPLSSMPAFWRARNIRVSALLSFLVITTLLSQFTSTILFWDVDLGWTLGQTSHRTVAFGLGLDDHVQNAAFALSSLSYLSLSDFPTFAEWSEDPKGLEELPDYIIDTGPTIRALLPISDKAERTTLREYTGPASLFDARVFCVRPNFTNYSIPSGRNGLNPHFKGEMRLSKIVNDRAGMGRITSDTLKIPITLSCGLEDLVPVPMGGYGFPNQSYRVFKACAGGMETGPSHGLTSQLDPHQNSTLKYSYSREENWVAINRWSNSSWWVEPGHTILFFDLYAPQYSESDWMIQSFFNLLSKKEDIVTDERGVWLDWKLASNLEGVRLSATVCYDAAFDQEDFVSPRIQHIQEFNITAARDSTSPEPTVAWNSTAGALSTKQLRKQLGVTKLKAGRSDRGVLSLNLTDIDTALGDYAAKISPQEVPDLSRKDIAGIGGKAAKHSEYKTLIPTYSFLNDPLRLISPQMNYEISAYELYPNWPIPLSQDSWTERVVLPDGMGSFITDIMIETEDPALAWQAMMTTLLRNAYYDSLPKFTVNGNASTTNMVLCQQPIRKRGFGIAMANIIIHLLLVLGTFAWFFHATAKTMIGDAWRVVSQLRISNIDEIVERVSFVEDKTVNDLMKTSSELRKRRVRL